MTLLRHVRLLAACLLLGLPAAGLAQTTDGYHAIQVLPVVVDTASFTQRITIRNPNSNNMFLQVDYYPADGTAQATPVRCNDVLVGYENTEVIDGLRAVCPGLAAGSNFGTLVLRSNLTRVFSVYSRVSNAQGAGFSVEGFAAHAFTSAESYVTGLRRLAATANSPAYQSNCFLGNLAEVTPSTAIDPIPDVGITLAQGWGSLGSSVAIKVQPGRIVRLLDVFSAVGAPAGDYDDVTAIFSPLTGAKTALLAFCTVQDNTSFGADFRIGKTERGGMGLGSYDNSLVRSAAIGGDFLFSGTDSVRQFSIPVGDSRNVHTLYFRHPDVISCAVFDAATDTFATVDHGLEMRLLTIPGGGGEAIVVAGGNDAVYFANVYLGDKTDLNDGFNSRYMLEVESNGRNTAANRPYKVRCVSGSGHTLGEMSLTGAPLAF